MLFTLRRKRDQIPSQDSTRTQTRRRGNGLSRTGKPRISGLGRKSRNSFPGRRCPDSRPAGCRSNCPVHRRRRGPGIEPPDRNIPEPGRRMHSASEV